MLGFIGLFIEDLPQLSVLVVHSRANGGFTTIGMLSLTGTIISLTHSFISKLLSYLILTEDDDTEAEPNEVRTGSMLMRAVELADTADDTYATTNPLHEGAAPSLDELEAMEKVAKETPETLMAMREERTASTNANV